MSASKDKVLIMRCEEYDKNKLRDIISGGMREFDFKPSGRVFIKPNLVFAHFEEDKYGTTMYTSRELTESTVRLLHENAQVAHIDIGEQTAVGMPTRMAYRLSGYRELVKRLQAGGLNKLSFFPLDEDRRKTCFVGGMVHSTVRLSRRMMSSDCRIYLSKLKRHGSCQITSATKLNIGILSDDERSVGHDYRIPEKITDLLNVGYPDFIVVDAIEAGVGLEGVPHPRNLGLVLMGTNPIAVDIVGAYLYGFAPNEIDYLDAAIRRGFRPGAMEDIELAGDVKTLNELGEYKKRLKPGDELWDEWQDVNETAKAMDAPIRFFQGPAVREEKTGRQIQCPSGCTMGVKMSLAVYYRAHGKNMAKCNPLTIVVGQHDDPIDCQGSNVLVLGSCARAELTNYKKKVEVRRCFTTSSENLIPFGMLLGLPNPMLQPRFLGIMIGSVLTAMLIKIFNGHYLLEIADFLATRLQKKI